jgi:PAS domain S-box-containing protein
MNDPTGDPSDDIARLTGRLRRMAADKSYLQLVLHMIDRVSEPPGLDATVHALLQVVAETIGGANAFLYYYLNDRLVKVGLYGGAETLDGVDDPLVASAISNRTFVEVTGDFSRTLMRTESFTQSFTWVFPLTVGPDLVGAFKIEDLHIDTGPWRAHLETFFNYVAVILKNDLLGESRLRRLNDELAAEVAVRKRNEEELRRAKIGLEERVGHRTIQLKEANDRLRDELAARRQAEREVARQREEYRLLLERIEAAVVVHAADTRIVSVNQKALELLGLTRDQAIGRASPHPEWRFVDDRGDPIPQEKYPVNQVLSTGAPLRDFICGVHRPEREDLRWVLINATPETGPEGTISTVVVTFMDISEHVRERAALARLSFAIDNASDQVVITDPDGRIVYVNHAFETTTGYRRDEAVGQTPRILKSGKHDAGFYDNLWATLRTKTPWHGVFINKKKDGTLYEEESTISPIVDDKGGIRYFVANKRDVTREAAFARARDNFASIVSHEIRTPLTKLELVKLLHESLATALPDQEIVARIGPVLDETIEEFQRLAHITNTFSNLVSHGERRVSASQRLDILVSSTVSLCRQQARQEGRNVDIRYAAPPPGEAIMVKGDYYLLSMALDEALSNAVKYTPDGKGVTVTLTCDDNLASIVVSDEGSGIPPEKIAMVFEPFYSLEDRKRHSTGKYKYRGGGLGLGLTVARLIVDAHGGSMEIRGGATGGGVTAIIRLAATVGPADDPAGDY